jgi:hypothetical protein
LHVLAFEDGYIHHPKPAIVQRICLLRRTPQISAEARALDTA